MTHQTWAAVEATVRGASHARRDLPNQDATGASPAGTTVVAAVADGHGDPRCCRADRARAWLSVPPSRSCSASLPGWATRREPTMRSSTTSW